tara:strand:- start:663 stop:1970 length:1308 start_codon:yes stop_codon:yes gene_type:complete
MKSQTNSNLNWTRNLSIKTKIIYPSQISDLKKIISNKKFICAGNQRSYGDMAVNSSCIVSMKKFNKLINFDKKKGLIEIESGVMLSNILGLMIQNGWFFPVTPGTKYVSVGGMIANNVHGKKTSENQIKYYVKEIKIMLQNKKVVTCSSTKNKKIFNLTIGGFGLTGIIISAKIKLKKISSSYIEQKIIEFDSYNQFFSHLNMINKYDYYVSWIQKFNFNKIKGLSYFGSHSKNKKLDDLIIKDKKLNFLNYTILKCLTQNYYLLKILNFLHKKLKPLFYKKTTNLYEYFYPQDKFVNWNKLYGNLGFVQIQFLIKKKYLKNIMRDISVFFEKEKKFSPFVVIKNYEEKGSYLNFVGKGISISMDVPIDNKFDELKIFFNDIFIKYDAMINLSKDFIADKKNLKKKLKYRKFKKDLNEFNKKNRFNSIFSRRLGF